jgi:hypothetical protein
MSATHEDTSSIVQRLILESLPPGAGEKTRIFGAGGRLDSLGLVGLLAELEYKLEEAFGRKVVLASERAMSRTRSPFHDVASLTDHVLDLLLS